MPPTPEQRARELIAAALVAAGWLVQDRRRLNLHAVPGIALCETNVEGGFADYMLFVDAKAIGVLEAKAAGFSLVSPKKLAQTLRWKLTTSTTARSNPAAACSAPWPCSARTACPLC
jgi:type I restriction enzyme R subunit